MVLMLHENLSFLHGMFDQKTSWVFHKIHNGKHRALIFPLVQMIPNYCWALVDFPVGEITALTVREKKTETSTQSPIKHLS